MKQAEFRTPNRMKFESEFKTFNKAVDLITTGNVLGNVLFSSYIDKNYNIYKAFPASYLKWLPDFIRLAAERRIKEGQKLWLYCLKLKGVPVAWILTSYDHKHILSARAGAHQYAKETSVLNEALKYLTESTNEK